jgi:hypothetical protein
MIILFDWFSVWCQLIMYYCVYLCVWLHIVEQELLTLPEHLSSPSVFSEVRATRSLVLCICFLDRCLSICPFYFGHCVVCPFFIDEFWLLKLFLYTFLCSPYLAFQSFDFERCSRNASLTLNLMIWYFFWPLCCLFFFDLRILITLWYIQTLLTVCSIKCLYKRLWVPCCDVRYDFRMKTMLGSSFPPVVCRMVDVLFLFYLCLFTHSGVQHILCCVFVLHCLRLVFVLNVASFSGLSFLDCPFGFL